MSHAAALDRLLALGGELVTAPGQPRRKFDLAHMRTLLQALGNPQLRFSSILIAGTNGKGSTAATLASILAAAGYSTGLYTSPHLTHVNERIRISSPSGVPGSVPEPAPDSIAAPNPSAILSPIADATLFAQLARVEAASTRLVSTGALPDTPSFFETMTAIAMLAFAGSDNPGCDNEDPSEAPVARPVDIAVLEVGMGGRLDATNVVEPLLSVITDISLDHTEWLGSTIDAIAREKAGILRPEGTMVTLPQHPEANQALGEVAVSLNVRGINAAEYLPDRQASFGAVNHYDLILDGKHLEVDSPLRGQHQQRNLALAIASILELRNHHGYTIPNSAIAAGIRDTDWPGRLELIRSSRAPGSKSIESSSPSGADYDPTNHGRADYGRADRSPEILLDVAHNPAGAWALRAALSQIDTPGPRLLLFGCMRDKALDEIAQILFPVFDHVWLIELPSPRTASVANLIAATERTGASYSLAPTPAAAFEAATHFAVQTQPQSSLHLGHRDFSDNHPERSTSPPHRSEVSAVDPAQPGMIVAAGSVLLVGALRDLLR